MKLKIAIAAFALTAASSAILTARSAPLQPDSVHDRLTRLAGLSLVAQKAISPDAEQAAAAIKILRASGPDGMNALEAAHENALRDAYSHPAKKQSAEWKRLSHAFEKVGAQRDGWASRLYWFSDLAKAKIQAQKENKPILSLRLLGNLDEELSCANSRFFRTALYPNLRVRIFLKTHYILHWESVRPVPKVTIDFGDGRKIETTITGNSIHYALDAEGRVLDALPGLNTPGAFFKWIERANGIHERSSELEGEARADYLKIIHNEELNQITRNWQNDIGQTKIPASQGEKLLASGRAQRTPQQAVQQSSRARQTPQLKPTKSTPDGSTPDASPIIQPAADETLISVRPTARNAALLALSKSIVEVPLVKAITVAVPRDRDALLRKTDDALWEKIAALHLADAALDNHSLEILRTKTTRAEEVAKNFQKAIAEDSVRNEYLRHVIIHQWLTENPNMELNALNKKVYAEIFLTPDSDPWLGLLPADAYSAIQNDGVITNK